MAVKATNKKVSKPKPSGKTNEITLLLSKALIKLKDGMGEKKFEKRIRKAAKLFSISNKPARKKKAAVKKGSSGKAAKKSK